jgi:hypothetical protein
MPMLYPPLESLLMAEQSSPATVAWTAVARAWPRHKGALLDQQEVRHHFDEFIVFLKR